MQKKKILAVHGYEFWLACIGILNEVVCQKIAKIHEQYDIIVMCCGWYFPTYQWDRTIAEVIKDRLIQLGVPKEKLHTQFSLGMENFIPPRDSMEDVDFLASLLKSLGFTPREIEFDAIGIWFMNPRLKYLYWTRKAKCRKVIGAYSGFEFNKDTVRKILTEFLAFPIMLFDPWGRGKIIARTRRKRTCEIPDSVNRENLPTAWE